MADLTITAANVLKGSSAKVRAGATAGATITAGQPVYIDATDGNKIKPASNAAQASAAVVGIALHGALDEQPIEYVTEDPSFIVGSTLVVGKTYVLSASGLISPIEDQTTGDWVTVLGTAISATALKFKPVVTGIQSA